MDIINILTLKMNFNKFHWKSGLDLSSPSLILVKSTEILSTYRKSEDWEESNQSNSSCFVD